MARKTFLSGKGDFAALPNGSGERLVAHHEASSVTPRTISKPDWLIGPKSASKVLLNGQPLSKCFLSLSNRYVKYIQRIWETNHLGQ